MRKRSNRATGAFSLVVLWSCESSIVICPKHRLNNTENMRYKLKPQNFNVSDKEAVEQWGTLGEGWGKKKYGSMRVFHHTSGGIAV